MTKPLRDDPRVTKTSSNSASATCTDCGKKWGAVNALGMASIHARAHGHVVEANAHLRVVYDGRDQGTS